MLLGRGGEWLTFKQIQSLGGRIKKGSKSRMVVFYKLLDKSETRIIDEDEYECKKYIPILRYYNVFHVNNCEGIESKLEMSEEVVYQLLMISYIELIQTF